MLEYINARLSIPTRLGLIGALFLVPIVFLTGIFLEQSLADIGFAQKEVAGTRYLGEVWPVFMDVAGSGHVAAANIADRGEYDALFDTGAASAAFADAKDPTAQLQAGKALIGAIADGSNLTLDPDLDSFYAMDAATVRIPGIAAAAVALGQAAAESAVTASRIVDVAFAVDHLRISSDDANASLTAAMKDNAEGVTAKALSGPTAALKRASDAMSEVGGALLEGREAGGLAAAQADLVAKIDAAWKPTNIELTRLLRARVDRFLRKMYLSLGVSGVFLAAAIFLSFVIARALSRRIHALIGVMDRLVAEDHAVAIPFRADVNETGKISRSLEVFLGQAVEKRRLEAEAVAEQGRGEAARERAAEEAIHAERERVTASFGTALANLADKNLDYRLRDEVPDAYRKLRADFNDAIGEIETALRGVRASADAIAAGAREITAASGDLSHRTEQQAASLEESTAALRDLADAVNGAAASSTKTKDIISAAKVDTIKSRDTVEKAIAAMAGIVGSSRQISAIVGVIDEIAFQTNLLALNAGVEAARAGDSGRGFAVVASEVRALAQRSAAAAKQINELISRSSAEASGGVALVGATGKAFDRIREQISVIDGGIADIASQAMDQSNTLTHVNTVVGEIDQTTQQNAAMAEQASAACAALSRESARLAAMVGEFRIGDEERRPRVEVRAGSSNASAAASSPGAREAPIAA
jgi:methyl-accepting chemotaxis protein